ncbi:LD-carboxypeptidase [uncultured Sphaerochaeta sp.]|uniref:S66 family peptidase n=1 Tax=uncultured Sphaerochaeta sp. TaxID=886478 RepID=UPI002A0A7870|nr:LD-carboxypeptidase [uncultured Sphaerochaeta sp.]
MQELIKPPSLCAGDTIATVSLSWGGAGDEAFLWRYNLGKARLEHQFGLHVIEMENTLKGSEYLYAHPEKRARDLMQAFENPDVKGVFSCIGGDESIRMLPYIDFEVLAHNPKIFLGYSDSTITHLLCFKAGLSSFYGPSVLAEFAENVRVFEYTSRFMKKVLFSSDPIGFIEPCKEWTDEYLVWTTENEFRSKKMQKNKPYRLLQGKGLARGPLFGGCLDVLEMAKGSSLWPEVSSLEGAILFFETSENTVAPSLFEAWLRNYGTLGILQRARGIVFGKPYQGLYQKEYEMAISKVLSEVSLEDLPVFCNLSFGHNEPMCTLPYGAMAEMDCENMTFRILDSGVN